MVLKIHDVFNKNHALLKNKIKIKFHLPLYNISCYLPNGAPIQIYYYYYYYYYY
jgi:hypothetical protein